MKQATTATTYEIEREEFIADMAREGLDLWRIQILLRCATALAELACNSEAADRDRVPTHADVPIQDWTAVEEAEQRARMAVPPGWSILTHDPRGAVLRVVPPSYRKRNSGRDVHNREGVSVPA